MYLNSLMKTTPWKNKIGFYFTLFKPIPRIFDDEEEHLVQENSTNGGNIQVYISRNKDQPEEGYVAAFLHATGINASLSLPTSHSYLLALYAHFGTRNAEAARRYWKHRTENTLALMKAIHTSIYCDHFGTHIFIALTYAKSPRHNAPVYAKYFGTHERGNTHKYILQSLWHSYPHCVNGSLNVTRHGTRVRNDRYGKKD
ncbi:hypothetical protein Glove_499g15 [Diversispora epigaea]|uniref:Uncharacterized protein n=1 Tax=Diversispora epigaea TaxID=1348612 RepID=A0A397GMZ3_9GLOM|nr:hypothetical protein Glove_499g15 [Diversispora epigaea]